MSQIQTRIAFAEQPIFVVGVPRSGTTLLSAMLAAHSRLSCGPETRFFRFLCKVDIDELCDSRFWPEKAISFLSSIKLVDRPVVEHYGLTRKGLHSYLVDESPSTAAMLRSLTEQFMQRKKKARWIEKSPEHMLYVNEIRKTFPKSPVIRIVRDPRDVALSLTNAPWAPSDFFESLMLWHRYDLAADSFFQVDENSYTVYFEKLVISPVKELKGLCRFIGEEFEPTMLDTSQSASSVVAKDEVWHRIVDRPVDRSRTAVWKGSLTDDANRLAEALIGDELRAHGFETRERFQRIARVYPSVGALLEQREAIQSLVSSGFGFRRAESADNGDLLVFVGDPDQGSWLNHVKPERWWNILRLIASVLRTRLAGCPILWIYDRSNEKRSSIGARMLAFLLRLVAERKVP